MAVRNLGNLEIKIPNSIELNIIRTTDFVFIFSKFKTGFANLYRTCELIDVVLLRLFIKTVIFVVNAVDEDLTMVVVALVLL